MSKADTSPLKWVAPAGIMLAVLRRVLVDAAAHHCSARLVIMIIRRLDHRDIKRRSAFEQIGGGGNACGIPPVMMWCRVTLDASLAKKIVLYEFVI